MPGDRIVQVFMRGALPEATEAKRALGACEAGVRIGNIPRRDPEVFPKPGDEGADALVSLGLNLALSVVLSPAPTWRWLAGESAWWRGAFGARIGDFPIWLARADAVSNIAGRIGPGSSVTPRLP